METFMIRKISATYARKGVSIECFENVSSQGREVFALIGHHEGVVGSPLYTNRWIEIDE